LIVAIPVPKVNVKKRNTDSTVDVLSSSAQRVVDLLHKPVFGQPDFASVLGLLCDTSAETTSQYVAAVKLSAEWRLVVLLDDQISCIRPAQRVVVADVEGTVEVVKWAELRRRNEWRVRPETAFAGDIWRRWSDNSEPPPLDFEATAWEGTHKDYSFGDTDWQVGWEDVWSFNLEEAVLRYDTPAQLRRGMWLELECAGATGTGGDIGYTLTIDKGSVWVNLLGHQEFFLGRVDPASFDPLNEIIGCLDGGGLNTVAFVHSEILGVKALREAVDRLAAIDVNFDANRIMVRGRGFEKSAADLLSR
jgi:hypothetical protein